MSVKILAFDGSGRKESINRNILDHVIRQAETHGAEVTRINLADFDLPIYNGDIESEQGIPAAVMELKELFKTHDAFLIASPEYNGSYTGLMKNTLDWVSRPVQGQPHLVEFSGKVAGLVTVANGKLSGMRGIYPLNTLLFSLGALVLPNIVSVGFYKDVVDENGQLKDEAAQRAVSRLAEKIVKIPAALKQAEVK